MIEYGTTSLNKRIPICGWMDFRNSMIGVAKRQSKRQYQERKGINLEWVAVERLTRNLSKNSKQTSLEIVRTQIPLIAANGMTIAKSQGSSLPSVVVHVQKYIGKNETSGLSRARERKITRENLYVACSRSTSLLGLFICGEFKAPETPKDDDPVTLEICRLREKPFNFCLRFLQDVDIGWNKIYFHNVQSFIAHAEDLSRDNCAVSSDYIALVEPHLLDKDSIERALVGYSCLFRANCRSIRNSEGALLYAKEFNTDTNPIFNSYYSNNGHCLFVTFHVQDVTVVMSYKSPAYNQSLYVERLEALLSSYCGKILLFGDINIDLKKKDGENIRKRLLDLNFKCIIDATNCSTDGGSRIDVCFANFKFIEAWFYESYYSYHKPICIIWPKK